MIAYHLTDRFLGDNVLAVQVAAVNALGDIGDVSATSDLVHGLTLPSEELRVALGYCTGQAGRPQQSDCAGSDGRERR